MTSCHWKAKVGLSLPTVLHDAQLSLLGTTTSLSLSFHPFGIHGFIANCSNKALILSSDVQYGHWPTLGMSEDLKHVLPTP